MYSDVDVYGGHIACLQCGSYLCQMGPPSTREVVVAPLTEPVIDTVIEKQRQGRPRLKFN